MQRAEIVTVERRRRWSVSDKQRGGDAGAGGEREFGGAAVRDACEPSVRVAAFAARRTDCSGRRFGCRWFAAVVVAPGARRPFGTRNAPLNYPASYNVAPTDPAERMEVYPIGTRVNSVKNDDDAGLLEPTIAEAA